MYLYPYHHQCTILPLCCSRMSSSFSFRQQISSSARSSSLSLSLTVRLSSKMNPLSSSSNSTKPAPTILALTFLIWYLSLQWSWSRLKRTRLPEMLWMSSSLGFSMGKTLLVAPLSMSRMLPTTRSKNTSSRQLSKCLLVNWLVSFLFWISSTYFMQSRSVKVHSSLNLVPSFIQCVQSPSRLNSRGLLQTARSYDLNRLTTSCSLSKSYFSHLMKLWRSSMTPLPQVRSDTRCTFSSLMNLVISMKRSSLYLPSSPLWNCLSSCDITLLNTFSFLMCSSLRCPCLPSYWLRREQQVWKAFLMAGRTVEWMQPLRRLLLLAMDFLMQTIQSNPFLSQSLMLAKGLFEALTIWLQTQNLQHWSLKSLLTLAKPSKQSSSTPCRYFLLAFFFCSSTDTSDTILLQFSMVLMYQKVYLRNILYVVPTLSFQASRTMVRLDCGGSLDSQTEEISSEFIMFTMFLSQGCDGSEGYLASSITEWRSLLLSFQDGGGLLLLLWVCLFQLKLVREVSVLGRMYSLDQLGLGLGQLLGATFFFFFFFLAILTGGSPSCFQGTYYYFYSLTYGLLASSASTLDFFLGQVLYYSSLSFYSLCYLSTYLLLYQVFTYFSLPSFDQLSPQYSRRFLLGIYYFFAQLFGFGYSIAVAFFSCLWRGTGFQTYFLGQGFGTTDTLGGALGVVSDLSTFSTGFGFCEGGSGSFLIVVFTWLLLGGASLVLTTSFFYTFQTLGGFGDGGFLLAYYCLSTITAEGFVSFLICGSALGEIFGAY